MIHDEAKATLFLIATLVMANATISIAWSVKQDRYIESLDARITANYIATAPGVLPVAQREIDELKRRIEQLERQLEE